MEDETALNIRRRSTRTRPQGQAGHIAAGVEGESARIRCAEIVRFAFGQGPVKHDTDER